MKVYRKKTTQEMRPYTEGEKLPLYVSISDADLRDGSPKVGDMIAVNPKDETDSWLVAGDFFTKNYEEVLISQSIGEIDENM